MKKKDLSSDEKSELAKKSLYGLKYLVGIARKTNEELMDDGLNPMQIGLVIHIMEMANKFSLFMGASGSLKELIEGSGIDLDELVSDMKKKMDETDKVDFGG